MKIRYNYLYISLLLLLSVFIWVLTSSVSLPVNDIIEPSDEIVSEEDITDPASKVSNYIENRPTLNELIEPLETLGPINSIVISQHGEIVAEDYYRGMHAGRSNNIKSASKSILSILTGIAIEKGYLESVDQEIGEFFPDYFENNPDSAKASITIGNLLTMRSGLASTSRGNYGRWVTSRNWIRYALDRPLTGKPGIDRIYSTGNTHLLSVIITRASGMSLLQFANRYLFEPIDIRVTGWDRDPQGYYLGGNNMALRPRDMIKIGQLMMDMGGYNGEQLVSGDWIIRSIEAVTGRGGRNNYGYLWFRRMTGDFHMIYAFGNGGQYIMIVPELDAVIAVTTSNNSGENTRPYRRDLFRSLDREIIPYLESAFTPEEII